MAFDKQIARAVADPRRIPHTAVIVLPTQPKPWCAISSPNIHTDKLQVAAKNISRACYFTPTFLLNNMARYVQVTQSLEKRIIQKITFKKI